MNIPAGLKAELGLLTQALDLPGTDLAQSLISLAAIARSAVESYVGLSVAINAHREEFGFTVLTDDAQAADVRTSLLVPLPSAASEASTTPASASVTLTLYAATPGAFIDLAADLSWMTGRPLVDFRLDEHRTLPSNHSDPASLVSTSSINQALGVLVGRGSTPEQAERDLYARAAAAGIELVAAADLVLDALGPPTPDPDPEAC